MPHSETPRSTGEPSPPTLPATHEVADGTLKLDPTVLVDVVPKPGQADGPRQIGPYVVQEEIGRGAMGAVFKALHTKLKRTVALKLLPSHVPAHPRQLSRFLREIEAIGRLDHPNIVRATDAGDFQNVHYLAMELVAGIDLQRVLLHVGRCSWGVACELARQTALGLQHIHEHHLVHRDIKPSNLLLTNTGVVKILDLGIALLRQAESIDGLTIDGTLMGTPDYMAPEQVDGTPDVDIRADIYSLGCTLYTLLTGRPPFFGPEYEPRVAKLSAQRTLRPPAVETLVPELPRELARALERMMAKSAAARYQTPGEVATALSSWADANALQQLAAKLTGQPAPAIAELDASNHRALKARGDTPRLGGTRGFRRMAIWLATACAALLLIVGSIRQTATDSKSADLHTLPIAHEVVSTPGNQPSLNTRTPASPSAADAPLAEPLSQVAEDTRQIRQDTSSLADAGRQLTHNTQRMADTLDDLRAAFLAANRHDGLIADPRTVGEVYHNARLAAQQGNYSAAREFYVRLLGMGAEYVDVHERFQEFLVLQEGRAGARSSYDDLPGDSTHVVRRYATALLEELPLRREQLAALRRERPDFAPATYALSRCWSRAAQGEQSLTEQLTEKELLEAFFAQQREGQLLRYFLDQSDAAAMIEEAQQRLAALQSLNSDLRDRPVSLAVTQRPSGWILVFHIAEAAREIQYRLDPSGPFVSTGLADLEDPRTGNKPPKTYVTLPGNTPPNTLEVRYTDVHGTMRGPFLLEFDPGKETLRGAKRELELTKSAWARFGTGAHANRLYFSHLAAYREAIAEVRYAIDQETPSTTFALPDASDGEAVRFHVEVSPTARFAVVQVTFRDGSQSDVVRCERDNR